MGTLFGFVVGYVVGARAGAAGFEELQESVKAIRESEEFTAFMRLLKEHAQSTVQNVSNRLAGGGDPTGMDDMLARARERLN